MLGSLLRAISLAIFLSTGAASVHAQTAAPPRQRIPYAVDTGRLVAGQPGVLTDFLVDVGGASWLRLHFGALELGGAPLDPERARVRITSVLDGEVQHLDAIGAQQWQHTSAYFNGGAVLVELLAGPGAGPCRVELVSVEAGLPPLQNLSICGPSDDRLPTADPRAARLMPIGCSGWLFDDCHRTFLTAGHCASGNMQVAQFDVPPSSSGGTVNHPPPSQQYAIDTSSVQTQGGAGVGLDWAYFGAFPNTETGLTPWQAQGAFYALTSPPTQAGTTMRITGYGTASGALNQTQQTSTGPFESISGTTLAYLSDTTGGNSGSPVVLHATGQAVGIHTHAGCVSDGGSNKGTSILYSPLQQALAAPKGICATPLLLLAPPPMVRVPDSQTIVVGGWVADVVPGSAFLRYRTGAGPFQQLPVVTLASGLVQLTLPAAACGETSEWYLELVDANCGPRTMPENAPFEAYSSVVGTLTDWFADGMEQDLGWSTEVLGATSGQWQRGVPVNDPNWANDPASDGDGTGSCWLTQNEAGNTDVDNGAVRLTSYPIALPSSPASLEYRYFLRLSNPVGDSLQVEVRVEPAGPWTQLVQHQSNNGLLWTTQSFSAAELAAAGVPQGATIRLRFTASDGDPQSFVEAGVDGLRVTLLECSGALGANVCTSGAAGATISATGSASVSANAFTLRAENVGPFVNGMFFHGDGLQQTPFGNGFLCLTSSTGLCRLSPVVGSGAGGVLERTLDLANQPVGSCAITAGSTRYFQAWFRQGASFDLTDALAVQFTN